MPTPTKGPRLGGSPAHERLMLANLATSLFKHGKITTTETKAKRLRPLAERLITKAKRGDLHARRRVLAVDPRQGRGRHALRRDRAAVRQPPGWLHPHREDRPAQGRRRSDGDHRAGRGAGGRRRGAGQGGQGRRPQGRQGRRGRGARRRDRRRRPRPPAKAAEASTRCPTGETPADGSAAIEAEGLSTPSRRGQAVRTAGTLHHGPPAGRAIAGDESWTVSGPARLDVGYDGTDFAGWAAQPGRRTVAGVLTADARRASSAPDGPPA